jgi:hypothetical protein
LGLEFASLATGSLPAHVNGIGIGLMASGSGGQEDLLLGDDDI